MSFNIHGFRLLEKQMNLIQLARSTGCDLLFHQETNYSSRRDMEWFKARFSCEAVFRSSKSLFFAVGVAVFNRSLLQTFSLMPDADDRVFSCEFTISDARHHCVYNYAPATPI